MKLYELTEAYRRISDLASEGEDFDQALEDIKDKFESKVIGVAQVVKELQAESQAIKGEATRLSQRAQSVANSAERLRNYLAVHMEATGVEKVAGDVFKVALAKSTPSCEVVDIVEVPFEFRKSLLRVPSEDVPEEMLEYRVEETVDKKKIIELWKEDEEVKGTLVKRGKHVTIR